MAEHDDQQPDESTQTESDWKRSISGGRRCGITAHNGLNDGDEPNGWWVSWSPRNGNDHAEGDWEDWVNLAREILEEDAIRSPKGVVPGSVALIRQGGNDEG